MVPRQSESRWSCRRRTARLSIGSSQTSGQDSARHPKSRSTTGNSAAGADVNLSVRQLSESDLPEADRIFRAAFGTFLGMPDPTTFGGDSDLVWTRWRADPSAALGAFH